MIDAQIVWEPLVLAPIALFIWYVVLVAFFSPSTICRFVFPGCGVTSDESVAWQMLEELDRRLPNLMTRKLNRLSGLLWLAGLLGIAALLSLAVVYRSEVGLAIFLLSVYVLIERLTRVKTSWTMLLGVVGFVAGAGGILERSLDGKSPRGSWWVIGAFALAIVLSICRWRRQAKDLANRVQIASSSPSTVDNDPIVDDSSRMDAKPHSE